MKRLACLVSAVALLSAGAASAADLYNGSLKDGGILGTPGNPSLHGFYGEIGVGYGFSQAKIGLPDSSGGDLAATGAFFNARAGYDKLLSGRVGAGVYVQGSNAFDVTGSAGSGSDLVAFGNQWGYGAGAKLFYDYGTGQAYVLLGYEGQDVTLTGTGTHHTDGFLWGGGISVKMTQNTYIGLEAVQIERGSVSGTATGIGSWSLGGVDDRVSLRFGVSAN